MLKRQPPRFSKIMREIGEMVAYPELVQARQRCLDLYAKDNAIPTWAYAIALKWRLEDGETVAGAIGADDAQLMKEAGTIYARYE